MKNTLLFLLSLLIFLSCNKKDIDVKNTIENEKNAYYKTFQQSLKAKMSATDFSSLDLSTAKHTKAPYIQTEVVRIAFRGSSLKNDFALLETDTTGNILRGTIIHLKYEVVEDDRQKTVHINGSMSRSPLDRSKTENVRIVNGRIRKDNSVAMEDESMPDNVEVICYLENKIGFSTWYAFSNMGGLSSSYSGYSWSSDGSGSTGNTGGSGMQEENPKDDSTSSVEEPCGKSIVFSPLSSAQDRASIWGIHYELYSTPSLQKIAETTFGLQVDFSKDVIYGDLYEIKQKILQTFSGTLETSDVYIKTDSQGASHLVYSKYAMQEITAMAIFETSVYIKKEGLVRTIAISDAELKKAFETELELILKKWSPGARVQILHTRTPNCVNISYKGFFGGC